MRATRERTNGRGAARDFRVRARARARMRGAPTGIRAPRVLLSLHQLPSPSSPPFRPHVYTRTRVLADRVAVSALPPIPRPSSSARSRRSARANFSRARGIPIPTVSIASPMHPRSLGRPDDRWTRSRNPVAPIEECELNASHERRVRERRMSRFARRKNASVEGARLLHPGQTG